MVRDVTVMLKETANTHGAGRHLIFHYLHVRAQP